MYGAEFFEHLAASPDRLIAFQQSMVARSQAEAADLLLAHDFGGYQHVIDIGGGFGVTLTAILTAHPALRGTLFDRPEVAEAAQARPSAAGVADRCTVVAGDAFDAVPRGGDLYLLSRVIHDWNEGAVLMDLHMLVLGLGKERTGADQRVARALRPCAAECDAGAGTHRDQCHRSPRRLTHSVNTDELSRLSR